METHLASSEWVEKGSNSSQSRQVWTGPAIYLGLRFRNSTSERETWSQYRVVWKVVALDSYAQETAAKDVKE